jgi:hypothetical protein
VYARIGNVSRDTVLEYFASLYVTRTVDNAKVRVQWWCAGQEDAGVRGCGVEGDAVRASVRVASTLVHPTTPAAPAHARPFTTGRSGARRYEVACAAVARLEPVSAPSAQREDACERRTSSWESDA